MTGIWLTLLAFGLSTSALSVPQDDESPARLSISEAASVFNSVLGSLDVLSTALHPGGISIIPATLAPGTVVHRINASRQPQTGSSSYFLPGEYLTGGFCLGVNETEQTPTLESYQTTRAMKFLYFDGNTEFAGASAGTMQKFVLEVEPSESLPAVDMYRKTCDWIADRVDGFVILGESLEFVTCRSDDDSLKLLSTAAIPAKDRNFMCHHREEHFGSIMHRRSTSTQVHRDTLKLHVEYAITGYGKSLPEIVDTSYPEIRRSSMSDVDLQYMTSETAVIFDILALSDIYPSKSNWFKIFAALEHAYTHVLQDLRDARSLVEFYARLDWSLLPYRPLPTDVNGSRLELCAQAFASSNFAHEKSTPTEYLYLEVATVLSRGICEALLMLQDMKDSTTTLAQPRGIVQDLVRKLGWPGLVDCEPVCDSSQVCTRDERLGHPSCRDAASIRVDRGQIQVDADAVLQETEASMPTKTTSAPSPEPTR